jgi:hypothetical protein
MSRWLWFSLTAILILGPMSACTKRVPVQLEGGKFDPSQRVAVTFEDGSQVVGQIGQDEHVQVIREGVVYQGTIFELSLDEIQVVDLHLIRRASGSEAEWQRLIDARRVLSNVPPEELIFRMDQIARVERIKVDALRTTTQSIFWTLTGAVSAFLFADRS